ncbi:unnamed protein product [Ilex paraguariensis]|uniref:Uncharacterized protein n=1 Tax=Ilex paraguariensis TaxID=185542 RepID=A0ABC8SUA4_9AQUA
MISVGSGQFYSWDSIWDLTLFHSALLLRLELYKDGLGLWNFWINHRSLLLFCGYEEEIFYSVVVRMCTILFCGSSWTLIFFAPLRIFLTLLDIRLLLWTHNLDGYENGDHYFDPHFWHVHLFVCSSSVGQEGPQAEFFYSSTLSERRMNLSFQLPYLMALNLPYLMAIHLPLACI